MQKESIKQNYLYNLTFQILNLLLPLITTPYISRILGAERIGVYSYTYSFVSTFVMVGALGIGTYGQREIASVNEDRNKYSSVFWEIEIVKTISVSVSFFLYILFALAYKDYQFYFLIQIPYFAASVLDISWFFQGIEKFKFVALRNICIKLISLIMIFALVKSADDLPIYIVLLCVSQVVGNLTMWMQLNKFVEWKRCSLASLKRHINPTVIYFIPTIAYQIHAVLDKAMLGLICNNNEENGYYEQAHKIINMAIMIISAYNVVMRSRMTSLFSKENWKEFNKNLQKSLHFITMIVFPMSLGIAGVSTNLIPWFLGDGYDKVIDLLMVFCPMFILQGLRSCIGSCIITPSRQQSKGNIVQCISAAVNVVLNFILIYFLASIGAAVASVVAEAVLLFGYLYYTKKHVTIEDIIRVAKKYFFSSILMFVPVFILSRTLQPSIINTLLIVMVGITVYFVSLWIMKDEYFLSQAKQVIQRVKKFR